MSKVKTEPGRLFPFRESQARFPAQRGTFPATHLRGRSALLLYCGRALLAGDNLRNQGKTLGLTSQELKTGSYYGFNFDDCGCSRTGERFSEGENYDDPNEGADSRLRDAA